MTLPRFVGRRANDCRNSGASKFTCKAERQSGVPSSDAKRADMKYPTSAGKKTPDLIKSGLRGDPTEGRRQAG